eukprot:6594452-Pyramimonas_sp.AAC.1
MIQRNVLSSQINHQFNSPNNIEINCLQNDSKTIIGSYLGSKTLHNNSQCNDKQTRQEQHRPKVVWVSRNNRTADRSDRMWCATVT